MNLKVNEKAYPYISCIFIALVILYKYLYLPLGRPGIGDEPYYISEVNYFARYGAYAALSQGTSFIYTLLIYSFSKITTLGYIEAARVLNVLFFLYCCFALLKLSSAFQGTDKKTQHFNLIIFATISALWLWKALPDFLWTAFLFSAFHILVRGTRYKHMAGSAVLLFLSFTFKPLALVALPAFLFFIFFRNLTRSTTMQHVLKSAVFCAVFFSCFAAYHIPSVLVYHKVQLEDKNHYYDGADRVETPLSWRERNVYFELYNPNNKPNKWTVTWGEIDSFKQAHPEIDLKLTHGQYIQRHTGVYLSNSLQKIFLSLPYRLQYGFFFSRWTTINRFIDSLVILKLITVVIFGIIIYVERKFIYNNRWLFSVPFLFYVALCFYVIPQLEDNWLLCCMAFFGLPVVRFLARYIHYLLLAALQLIYFLAIGRLHL